MSKLKCFIIFMTIILMSLSACAAADNDNITQSNPYNTEYQTESNNDENIMIEHYETNEQTDNEINTQNLIQKKNVNNIKSASSDNITTITEDNYNDYLKISNGKATLNQTYFVPKNNYTINFQYVPTNTILAINNFYSNKYKNDTIKITGTINNTNLQLSKGMLKSLLLEDLVLNYNNDFTGDYVNIPSTVNINNITINVYAQRNNSNTNVLTVSANSTIENCTINVNSSGNTPTIALNAIGENITIKNCIINADITSNRTSSPLYLGGENSVVENCTINAKLPSSQVAWDDNSLPKGIGVWINAFYTTLRNNKINITESCILSDGTHRSLYGVYVRGINTELYNNTITVEGTQYTYGFVVRASQNRIYDNNITVKSVYYSAGVNIEGNGMKNNYIQNNIINASAGFEQTDNGNPDVAYGCLILDFSYGGYEYVASASSMENNRYINNTVIADARQSYGFELWGGVNTQIINNNMTVTGNYPMGIGTIGINTTIDNNTILADGTSNDTEYSADWIKPRTAGVYVYGTMEGNRVTNNTVAVTNGRALYLDNCMNLLVENNFLLTEDYAYVIEVANGTNTFKNNGILGDGTTSEVIKDTTDNENTYINNREPTPSILTITTPETIKVNEDATITVSLKDEDNHTLANQYITLQVEDDVQTVLTNDEGEYTFTYTPTTDGEISINALYECYGDYGSSATATISVTKYSTNFQYYQIKDANINDTIKISAKLLSNGQPVKYQDVTVTVNGEDYSARTSSSGYFVLNYVATTAGVNNITFTYDGNSEYESVTSTTTFNVIGDKKETNFLYYNIKDVNLGDTVKISAKLLSDGQPVKSQNIIITVNGKNYTAKTSSTGYFTLNYQTTTAGTNNITFTYNGNTEYKSVTSTTTFNVIGDKKETNFLYYNIKDVNLGDTVKISAKLLSDGQPVKSQNIIITVNGKNYTAKTSSTGYFTLNYQTTTAGVNNITFTYDGNSEYESITSTTTFNVIGQKSPTMFQYYNFKDTTLGNSVKISAKLLSDGQPVKYQDVTVTINGENFSARTSSTGYFILNYMTTTSGINNVTFTYNGNTEYDGVTNTTTFKVI